MNNISDTCIFGGVFAYTLKIAKNQGFFFHIVYNYKTRIEKNKKLLTFLRLFFIIKLHKRRKKWKIGGKHYINFWKNTSIKTGLSELFFAEVIAAEIKQNFPILMSIWCSPYVRDNPLHLSVR